MKFKALACAAIVCLWMFASPQISRSEGTNNVWTIYVAIKPREAYNFVQWANDTSTDITVYRYPLYVGYFYTDDSLTVKWKCIIPLAEKEMEKWAAWKSNPQARAFDDWIPGRYRKAKLGDPDYADIASYDMSSSGFHAIKIANGKLPDDSWVPQFTQQYAIDFPNAKQRIQALQAIVYREILDKPVELREYRTKSDEIDDYLNNTVKELSAWHVLN